MIFFPRSINRYTLASNIQAILQCYKMITHRFQLQTSWYINKASDNYECGFVSLRILVLTTYLKGFNYRIPWFRVISEKIV